jgi:hypothetical protein
MKSVKILALAFGLILLVSAAGFAQTSMTTTYATIPVAPNAQTGLVGEVDFVPLVNGNIPAGESITVTYGAPISSTSDILVYVLGCAQPFSTANFATPVTCGASTVTVTPVAAPGTTVLLSFAGTAMPTTVATQFVRITGVRLNVASISPAVNANINASVTNSTGVGSITNNFVPVAQVQEAIAMTGSGPFTCAQTGCTLTTPYVTITEQFTNAFETKGATNPTQLLLAVTPPAGFTFASASYTSNQVLANTGGLNATLKFANTAGLTININSQNPQSLESIVVPIYLSALGPVALSPGNATVTATLAPPLVAPAVTANVGPQAGQSPLLYLSRTVSALITFTVQQFTTTLYAPFSTWVPGFNTGFAIGNPTGVVRTGVSMFFSVAQPGVVKAWLVPNDGSAVVTVTTSATVKPGIGLNAAGQIPAGGEWSVLLSELATAAGLTSFQGQVFFETQFSDAHGVNFISDPTFSIMAQGYPLLVISGMPSGTTSFNN